MNQWLVCQFHFVTTFVTRGRQNSERNDFNNKINVFPVRFHKSEEIKTKDGMFIMV